MTVTAAGDSFQAVEPPANSTSHKAESGRSRSSWPSCATYANGQPLSCCAHGAKAASVAAASAYTSGTATKRQVDRNRRMSFNQARKRSGSKQRVKAPLSAAHGSPARTPAGTPRCRHVASTPKRSSTIPPTGARYFSIPLQRYHLHNSRPHYTGDRPRGPL